MIGARAAPWVGQDHVGADRAGLAASDLYRRIGEFLADHRLSPDPGHFAFAYHVVRDADGPLGEAVARITEGGVRLTRRDIEALGGTVSDDAPPLEPAAAAPPPATFAAAAFPAAAYQAAAVPDGAAGLVARTQHQVEGFATVVQSIQDETRGFGRDLQASAEAIRRSGDPMGIDDIVELTRTMVERVRATERRLEATTQEVEALRERLKEAHGFARRDALTDLPNRRAFEEAYAALVPGARACLAICDVDWFKRVNDGFGHAVGDRVLTAIGRALESQCAPHLVARYGGEEFVILIADAEPAAARALIEGARRSVAARRFRARDTDEPLGTITISAGIGAVRPGEPVEDAVARIDEALYRAKAGGRNQVALAPA